ncbi:GTP cyclohydrolase IIa [Pyrolobus fumarii]|uniref:GTP cyclohydrolase IIa n=1 Tax=Pyrolobus fumarii TaxID=54252 RepID=UPI001FCA9B10|nr:GTP cyclohydrolase IIa [Pyrolobus fumarii]
MVRLALYVLKGYREWTESLGEDREWLIQSKQGELHSMTSVEAALAGGIAIPFRHDVILVAASGVPGFKLEALKAAISRVSPVPVELRIGCDETPAGALDRGFRGEGCKEGSDALLLAHVDIDDITGFAAEHGLYASYLRIEELRYKLVDSLSDYGALVSYLGGDNIIVLLPFDRDALETLIDVVESEDAKAGIGFSYSARRAASLATKCLDSIRRLRGENKVRVCIEGEAPSWLRVYAWETGGLL